MARCSGTLWFLDRYHMICTSVSVLRQSCDLPSFIADSSPVSIDLSKAIKLRDVSSGPGRGDYGTPNHRTQTPRPSTNLGSCASLLDLFRRRYHRAELCRGTCEQWFDPDRLPAQSWVLHCVCPKVVSTTQKGERGNVGDYMECLLLEITTRDNRTG